MVRKRPQRYAGFAALPLRHSVAAAVELQRCIKDLGFKARGSTVRPRGHHLDDDRHLPVWERAQDLDVNFVITTSGMFDPAPLAAAMATVGKDNILFSVDLPVRRLECRRHVHRQRAGERRLRAKICSGNARRVLRL